MTNEGENLLERLREGASAEDGARLQAELAGAHAADIADVFEELSDEERSAILFALPPHTAAEVIVLLDEAVRGEVVEDLDTAALTGLVSELQPDDAADMLGELAEKASDEILEQMPDEQSELIEELLKYDEETAGGIMTPDVVAIPDSATVGDTVEDIRKATPEEDLHEIYIVNDDGQPVGTVPLTRLVTNPPETKLADICDLDPVTVYAGDDQETVVQLIRKYDVASAAVVDENERLIGRITHDDLLDAADEEAEEDLFRMAGTDPAEFETHSVFRAARIRLTWILPCMFGMLMSATVLRLSQPHFDVALWTALVLFVPMIGATGGNSGVQIATVIVRGFATGDAAASKPVRALLREGRIALAIAPACGFVAWASVSFFFPLFGGVGPGAGQLHDPARVAIAVGTAMTTAVLMAAVLGIALPFTFKRFGVDPAIASGPLVTSMNDIVSVGIYMVIAMLIAR